MRLLAQISLLIAVMANVTASRPHILTILADDPGWGGTIFLENGKGQIRLESPFFASGTGIDFVVISPDTQ